MKNSFNIIWKLKLKFRNIVSAFSTKQIYKNMRLTKSAIGKINTLETRLKLALLFKVTERRVSQMIDKNKNNGPLTTAGALAVIRHELKVNDDSKLLEVTEKLSA